MECPRELILQEYEYICDFSGETCTDYRRRLPCRFAQEGEQVKCLVCDRTETKRHYLNWKEYYQLNGASIL